ncbi:hypothetical protein PoB_002371600 [Plakobranchus ocellatus]|uniref:Uncharacterized protein n=1 Tax=Plakobranchus ocellatus TaxID=259542 RepID=A0AAV3ZRT1_9GAST|nr:hypothetical protein PoB_002371600 [Plakobranchus ocellatus]
MQFNCKKAAHLKKLYCTQICREPYVASSSPASGALASRRDRKPEIILLLTGYEPNSEFSCSMYPLIPPTLFLVGWVSHFVDWLASKPVICLSGVMAQRLWESLVICFSLFTYGLDSRVRTEALESLD